jgi:hypothetical protein
VFRMADANSTREGACFSPCPFRALRLPSLCTAGKQVTLCDHGHPSSWGALGLTRSARVCFAARLADLLDTGGQGQRSP